MALLNEIPVVSFQEFLLAEDLSTCPQVQELHKAFTQVGFVCLKNHGIDMEIVSLYLI